MDDVQTHCLPPNHDDETAHVEIMMSRASLLCKGSSLMAPMMASRHSSSRAIVNSSHTTRFATKLSTMSSALPRHTSTISTPPNTLPSTITSPTPTTHQLQIRTFAGRKDRHSATFETRPPTKKQRKAYHRRQRKVQYETDKHSLPNSKATARRLEDKENTQRLIEIAQEEEDLKGQLSVYFDKVKELQTQIESTDKFQTLLQDGKVDPKEIKSAAREAAIKAAEKKGMPHPPLPSWIQERMTYDWGDALIDDLMGNSADLTSSPSPFPVYMGGEYGRLRRKVERTLRLQEEERLLLEGGDASGKGGVTASGNKLPATKKTRNSALSDKLISDLLRSYRDAHGKRTTPVGLAPALQLLFQEMNIPRSTLETYSYVSLLTCCKNPWEARKVNEMRKEDGVRSNGYFWSALVDVYARSGDYRGAENVLDEMLEETKMEHDQWEAANSNINDKRNTKVEKPITIPPLPAYTSFFSACHKLISRPDVHPSIKSDASSRAWARWKEMRIHSVPPDVMAYGAMMRVFSAQGRAEKAVDLLDEIMMQMMMPVSADNVLNNNGIEEEILRSTDGDEDGWYDDRDGQTVRVKPTTLLFTSALKSVAKSHEIATRFSGGKSKKNRRRETIASYHGRLARKIVILAEQAEVEQDDGFIAALMLCSAASGDSSTARAIYLASKVRRLDHLRTCGGKVHLKRLQGLVPEEERQALLDHGDSTTSLTSGSGGSVPSLRTIEEEFVENHKSYERREYGTDTRVLSTLLLAHSKAMEPQGLGSIWAGKYNRGYLCENSLRWIEAYNQPQMSNMAIPGITSVEAGLTAEGWEPEDFDDADSKRLSKGKRFNTMQIADDGEGNQRDDMDSFFDGFDPDPEEVEVDNLMQLNGGATSRDWLNDRILGDGESADQLSEGVISTAEYRPGQMNSMNCDDDEFDSDEEDEYRGREGNRDDDNSKVDHSSIVKRFSQLHNDPDLGDDEEFNKMFDKLIAKSDGDGDDDFDNYFDEDEFNKLMSDTMHGMDDSKGGDADELDRIPGIANNDFASFRSHLKAELVAEGATHDVDEVEAKQLFDMMRTYYDDSSDAIPDANYSGEEDDESETFSSSFFSNEEMDLMEKKNAQANAIMNSRLTNDIGGRGAVGQRQSVADTMQSTMGTQTMYADDYLDWANPHSNETNNSIESHITEESVKVDEVEPSPIDMAVKRQKMLSLREEDPHITELRQVLPGLPLNRIEKVSDEFSRVLGYPSILRLALVLRENMPDELSPQCLTRKNLLNAQHLFSEASKNDLVDIHLLNGMLQVQTNSGRIEPAIRFYDTEYKKHDFAPTSHSDRLLIDMLVRKKRISRALKLKESIESEGRTLDLLSYGSLVEHFGKQKQLGSAILLIKECNAVHGSPPGEKSLKPIRLMCRQQGLTQKVHLDKIIGKDPLQWLHDGKELKKKKSKKGGSQLQYGMNRMLDI